MAPGTRASGRAGHVGFCGRGVRLQGFAQAPWIQWGVVVHVAFAFSKDFKRQYCSTAVAMTAWIFCVGFKTLQQVQNDVFISTS